MVMPMSEVPMPEVSMSEVPMDMMVMPMVPMIRSGVAAEVAENGCGGNQTSQ
jgi:hypothetical protein